MKPSSFVRVWALLYLAAIVLTLNNVGALQIFEPISSNGESGEPTPPFPALAESATPPVSSLPSGSKIGSSHADEGKEEYQQQQTLAQPSQDQQKPPKQLLKPKKQAEIDLQRQGAHAEAQIISQHERNSHLHYQHSARKHQTGGGSQQRLVVNKHRDQKIMQKAFGGGSNSAAESSNAGKDAGALSALVDSFKGGISSRSSIVKAISDNKLARTLTGVSKAIGGNKYVAGSMLAAAIGLTLSKLLLPYMTVAKLGGMGGVDPLLTSGSSPPGAFASDRSVFAPQSQYPSSVPQPYFTSQYIDPTVTSYPQPLIPQPPPSTEYDHLFNEYAHYKLTHPAPSMHLGQTESLGPFSQPSSVSFSSEQSTHQLQQPPQSQQQFNEPYYYGTPQAASSPQQTSQLSQPQQHTNMNNNDKYAQNNSPSNMFAAAGSYNQPADNAQSGSDPMFSEASNERSLYVPRNLQSIQPQQLQQQQTANGRRSGSIQLKKLDASTKFRISELVQQQQHQKKSQPAWTTNSGPPKLQLSVGNEASATDSANKKPDSFVPLDDTLPLANNNGWQLASQEGQSGAKNGHSQQQQQRLTTMEVSADRSENRFATAEAANGFVEPQDQTVPQEYQTAELVSRPSRASPVALHYKQPVQQHLHVLKTQPQMTSLTSPVSSVAADYGNLAELTELSKANHKSRDEQSQADLFASDNKSIVGGDLIEVANANNKLAPQQQSPLEQSTISSRFDDWFATNFSKARADDSASAAASRSNQPTTPQPTAASSTTTTLTNVTTSTTTIPPDSAVASAVLIDDKIESADSKANEVVTLLLR